MLPIRNGSSFSLLQQRLRGLIVCNFATKIRFLSEKAKSFSIFLQITEVLQMEIGAHKKRDEAKTTLLHLFLYDLIFSILLHIVNHLHEFLAQFISLLHGRGLAIYADDRLGITLAEVNPLVRKSSLTPSISVTVTSFSLPYISLTFTRIASTSVDGVRSMRFFAMK